MYRGAPCYTCTCSSWPKALTGFFLWSIGRNGTVQVECSFSQNGKNRASGPLLPCKLHIWEILTLFSVHKQSEQRQSSGERFSHVLCVCDGQKVTVSWICIREAEWHVCWKVKGIFDASVQLFKTSGYSSVDTESSEFTLKLQLERNWQVVNEAVVCIAGHTGMC